MLARRSHRATPSADGEALERFLTRLRGAGLCEVGLRAERRAKKRVANAESVCDAPRTERAPPLNANEDAARTPPTKETARNHSERGGFSSLGGYGLHKMPSFVPFWACNWVVRNEPPNYTTTRILCKRKPTAERAANGCAVCSRSRPRTEAAEASAVERPTPRALCAVRARSARASLQHDVANIK